MCRAVSAKLVNNEPGGGSSVPEYISPDVTVDSEPSTSAQPSPSLNLLADSIFAQGLGTDPIGLVPDIEDFDPVTDLLPVRQRISDVMIAAHETVDRKVGTQVAQLSLAELQALRTQISLREKQLLTTRPPEELFAPIDPDTFRSNDADSSSGEVVSHEETIGESRLTLLDYAQIREEHSNLTNIVSTRATADLVQMLQKDSTLQVPGSRQGKTPLASAISYVASALKITAATVDRRLTAAAAMWPSKHYRRTKLKTPRLAMHLERGQISFATATTAQNRLATMRQAVRRAGGDDATADKLVKHQEKEFLRHAIRNDPYTFARFAKRQCDAVTNELVGPRQILTDEQVKFEKGIFYQHPIGDRLHELSVVVDDGELLQFNALREFGSTLHSEISSLRAQAHQPRDAQDQDSTPDNPGVQQHLSEHVPTNSRITPEDIDLGIAKLFDGQTRAERWLNTLMDFVSSGFILHKTYDPQATADTQQRRHEALSKAAAHSEIISDLLGQTFTRDNSESTKPRAPSEVGDPVEAMLPAGYQLLRPNLDLIVEIPLRDLLKSSRLPNDQSKTTAPQSDMSQLFHEMVSDGRGLTAPRGSPGDISIDIEIARQQACDQRVIPMVLGTASQPLDVGRAQRNFPVAIRRALHVRDRGCIVPGCSRPAEWCQPHHLDPWANGGPTSLANAALLCRHHHAAVHKQLLTIHMEDDGLPSCSLPETLDPSQTRYRNTYWQRC